MPARSGRSCRGAAAGCIPPPRRRSRPLRPRPPRRRRGPGPGEGQIGDRGERAAGGSPGPVGQDPAALVEGVLWLGQLLGRRHRRRGLGEACERLGLARVEAGETLPDHTKLNSS